LKLLEIGLAGGASLRTWEKYFPNSTIVGVDINLAAKAYARPRVTIEIADQSDAGQLSILGETHGPFDIIIDDGSHFWEHQITTLQTLFPFLRDDGFYVIEDLHTSFYGRQSQWAGASSISCIEYLKKMVDIKVADDQIDISKEKDQFLKAYGRKIDFISFYREACLLRKGYSRPHEQPIVVIENDAAPKILSMVAHIGGYGDKKSETSVVSGRDASQYIQGISIFCADFPREDISYRARLLDGSWTDWVQGGEFVGTRGANNDLTGLSIRLSGEIEQTYSIKVICRFRGLSTDISAGNGQDCCDTLAARQLRTVQIILVPK
jgi:hypothetical protein